MPFDIFAIEDLTSIRVQSRTKGTDLTRKLNNWAFYELDQFLRYKAEAMGKSVVTIDPRYTSQNVLLVDISTKETGKDILSSVLSVVFKYMLTSMLLGILPFSVYLETVGCL